MDKVDALASRCQPSPSQENLQDQKIHVYAWDANDSAKELTDSGSLDLTGCPDNLE